MADEFIPYAVIPTETQYTYKKLYTTPSNEGMFEGYYNVMDSVVGGNVGNLTYTPIGNVNVGGGVDLKLNNDKIVDPYAFASLYRDDSEFRAFIDKNTKRVSGKVGPGQITLTKTPEELIKEYTLNFKNLGVSMTDTPYGKSYGANINIPVKKGNLSASAFKNDFDKGLFFNYGLDF